ncbi:MAG: CoB--CoM heterodisulfide reductase iron-sulfur subunit B family protein [Thermodesulfobacteriota bacterium]|nr:CoB--CoM heterodisulfide reductase iron-sulfur subunit B family protein [Thermodesulfobacteriota bacterium]
MKYAYYPGCSLHSTAADYQQSIDSVFKKLSVELAEIEDWTCCGASAAHVSDLLLPLVLPAKDLLKAEQMGLEVVAPCAACYNRMRQANHKLHEDKELRKKVNQLLQANYQGKVKVRHISDVVVNEYGLEAIAKLLVGGLKGLKVVCYYGCLSARPQKIVAFDDPVYPSYLDRLIQTLGGEAIEWPFKTECCGGSFSVSKKDVVLKLTRDLLDMGKSLGAEAVVVDCPLCQFNLDFRQEEVEKKYGAHFGLPVFYFTQLLGICLGVRGEELGLKKLNVDPFALLEKKNIQI